MSPGRIVLLVVGSIAALVGLGSTIAGGALVWVHASERDADGYYVTSTETFTTSTYAVTSEDIDLGTGVRGDDWGPFDNIGTARIVVRSVDDRPIFVGIARHVDVARLLAGSAHDELTDVGFDPFRASYRHQPGEVQPPLPDDQPFWVAQASGSGRQTVRWEIEQGEWAVVVMNADASRGVTFDASVGINTGLLLPLGLGFLAGGLVMGAVAAALIVASLRGRSTDPAPAGRDTASAVPATLPGPTPAGAYPVHITGLLEEPLSRWMWLVKWFLAIPHLVVLAVLWAAFAVLTVVAGFAILFTGRYPRGIFDFNVGVLRWSWRVTFYAFTLGTDRYPPFSLQPDAAYPADLTVPYPAQLSRSLVLVKWWLLALPHYLVISVFGGGLTWWTWTWMGDGGGRAALGGGLIGLLVVIAGVVLAVTSRYPRPVFDFVMGMPRWTYRVWAYAALLRDDYPPFRLDNGGIDPGSAPPTSSPLDPTPGDRAVQAPAARGPSTLCVSPPS